MLKLVRHEGAQRGKLTAVRRTLGRKSQGLSICLEEAGETQNIIHKPARERKTTPSRKRMAWWLRRAVRGPLAVKLLGLRYGYACFHFVIICLAIDFDFICSLVYKLCFYNKSGLNICICKKTIEMMVI